MKEAQQKAKESIVFAMLEAIGDSPNRPGLVDTPQRVVKMWSEVYRGYDLMQRPKITVFDNYKDGIAYDQIIVDTGYFFSICEHHMVPFYGSYAFGYIPNKKVMGLSKVARVVDFFSSKLQVQERLTKEIVDYIEESLTVKVDTVDSANPLELKPEAIGLVLKGRHLCKEMRGVKKVNGVMTTSDLRGDFRDEPETRAEFFQLIK